MRRRSAVFRVVTAAVAGLVLAGTITAASASAPAPADAVPSARHGRPRIELSSRSVMVDQAVGIAVKGVDPNAMVRLDLVLDRQDGTTWASHAVFRSDRRGRVDVATMAPREGDYQGVDAMGLFWSARRQAGAPSADLEEWTDTVRLTASVDGRQVAAADLKRHYLRPGTRVTPVRDQGLVGTLFEPRGPQPAPHRHGRRPALIVLGGSEGGLASAEVRAAVLASHGYDALALAYFDPAGTLDAGLPDHLSLIPLEYFATAIDWLGDQQSVDPERIGVVGASKGAELALLLASRHPELRTVVAYDPSSVAWAGFGTASDPSGYFLSSWSEDGQPVPFLQYDFSSTTGDFYTGALADDAAVARAAIPVERIAGPVLLVSGRDDQLWPSTLMADQIVARLDAHQHPYDVRHLAYDGAGHGTFPPYQPTTDLGSGLPLGGTPGARAHAARDHWPRLLHFLAAALQPDDRAPHGHD